MVTINQGTALMDGDAETVLMELAVGIEAYANHLGLKPTDVLAELTAMFSLLGRDGRGTTGDDTH